MVNSGQVCLAAKRVYVHDSMYDAFCAELAKLAETAVIGNGPDPATQFGRLQNKGQYEKVQGYIDEARRRGRIVAGGTREPGSGYFILSFAPWMARSNPDLAPKWASKDSKSSRRRRSSTSRRTDDSYPARVSRRRFSALAKPPACAGGSCSYDRMQLTGSPGRWSLQRRDR